MSTESVTEPVSALQGIVGIEAPLPPPASGWEPVLLGLIFTLVAALALWLIRRHYTSTRSKARRRLARLQIELHSIDQAAFQLAAILADGLGLRQLSPATALPERLAERQASWQDFMTRLAAARYAPASQSTDELRALCREARIWLRLWP